MTDTTKAAIDALIEKLTAEYEASYPRTDSAYLALRQVLDRAYDQASVGKGKERHVKEEGQAFQDQPICTLQRIYGTGYGFGQAGKKTEESQRLPRAQAVAEILGAIVYLAAAVIVLEEGPETTAT